jgi:hypothetical protein
MAGKDNVFAYGVSWGYLVVRGETEVRLSRFAVALVASNLTAAVASEAVRNVIVFPLGRGPGRPGGEPELDALVTSAKVYAERFESGESLEGYPAWQQPRVMLSTGTIESSMDLPRDTDWAWADGTPLPEDRWPPVSYHGPLYLCGDPLTVHAAHWIPPTPFLNDGNRSWCPGMPEPGSQVAVPGAGSADGCAPR